MTLFIVVAQYPLNPDYIKGGVHSAVKNLLDGFASTSASVVLVTFTREVKRQTTHVLYPNVTLIYEPEGIFPFHSPNYLFSCSFRLFRLYKTYRPDVVHFQNGNTFLFSGIFLPPSRKVLTIHGFSMEEAKRKLRWTDKFIWYYNGLVNSILLPRAIIHLSNFSYKKMKLSGSRHIQTILRNAISDSFFLPLKEPPFTFRFLYIGVIDNNKNLLYILNTIVALKARSCSIQLTILGDYNTALYRTEVMDFLKRHDISGHLSFKGWVNRETLLQEIRLADGLIVASKHEMLPMSIAECKAAGKLVLASRVGGIPEMIQDGEDGFLFDISDKDSLARQIMWLGQHLDKIGAMQLLARTHAEKQFKASTVATDSIEFYSRCLEN